MNGSVAMAYADLKLVKTRSVVQLVFEAPLEHVQKITDALGFPNPGEERWFGIVPLEVTTRPEERQAPYASQSDAEQARTRAAMLCEDERFREWVNAQTVKAHNKALANTGEEAAAWLRTAIGASTRKKIATDPEVYANFLEIETRYRTETGQAPWRKE